MDYLEDDELVNERFLEDARMNFSDAAEQDDLKTCRLIILDIKDKGFTSEAHILERELNYKASGVMV